MSTRTLEHVSIILLPWYFQGVVSAQTAMLQWSAPIDVNAEGQGELRPRIDLNGDGAPVVLWGASTPANYVAVGTGDLFSAPIEVSGPGVMPAVADWMGSSLAAVGNTVWVVMKTLPEESRPVYVRRSDDGGYTWGDTLRVDPYDGLVSRFPTIAVSDPDVPIVQYMQFDFGWSGARQVTTHLMGDSFMAPVQVSTPFAPGEVCDCCPNQVLAEGDRAVAFFRNAGSNVRVMWGAVSENGGETFPVGGVVDTTGWSLAACPSSGPDGYFAGDSLRYVWMSGANSGTKVYLGSALASDLSLGAQRFVHPGQSASTQQNFPRIAGRGDTLGVVWENFVSGAREINFSWSTTGVDGLSSPEIVNLELSGSQKTPDIAYADGSFHIVWSEAGSGQVRYRRATLTTDVGLSGILSTDATLVWPNPVADLVRVTDGRWLRAEITDAQGRSVVHGPLVDRAMDASALSAGVYSMRLIDARGTSALVRIVKR